MRKLFLLIILFVCGISSEPAGSTFSFALLVNAKADR